MGIPFPRGIPFPCTPLLQNSFSAGAPPDAQVEWGGGLISNVWTIIEVRADQKYHRTLVCLREVEFSPRF